MRVKRAGIAIVVVLSMWKDKLVTEDSVRNEGVVVKLMNIAFKMVCFICFIFFYLDIFNFGTPL